MNFFCSSLCSDLPSQSNLLAGRCHKPQVQIPLLGYTPYFQTSIILKRGTLTLQRPCCPLRSAWRDVVDPTSGGTYYWNTETNETTWEKPSEIVSATHSTPARTQESSQDTEKPAIPNTQILQILKDAYSADTSGMLFWEVARSHRGDGVFDEAFTDFLNDEVEAASDEEARALLQKVQARLSNPLLRQAAPFEF